MKPLSRLIPVGLTICSISSLMAAEGANVVTDTFAIEAITYTPDIVAQGAGSVEAEVTINIIGDADTKTARLLFQLNGFTQEECMVEDPPIEDGNYTIRCTLTPDLLKPVGPRRLIVQLEDGGGSVIASANSDNGYSVGFNPDRCGTEGTICVTDSNSSPGENPIQKAIDVANAGDTVFVGPGNWGLIAQLNVDKSINLVGEIAAGNTSIYPLNEDVGIVKP